MNVEAYAVTKARSLIEEGAIPYGPRTHPCVCGAGVHEHAGGARTGGCKRTGCKRYRVNRAYELAYRALDAQHTTLGHALRAADDLERAAHYKANPRQPGEWSIGASDSSTCPRKIQYRNAPPEDMVYAPEDKREARMGTIIHNEVTRKMRLLYPWREFGGRVMIPGLDRASEFDSYDPITRELEDYKCTTWDTPVLMADGTEKRAADVVEGDAVVGWNEDSLIEATIAFSGDNGVQPIYRIETAGGRILRVTAEHPVLVGRTATPGSGYRPGPDRIAYEWVKADGVRFGDRVVLALGWDAANVSGISDDDAYLLGALTGDGGLTGYAQQRTNGYGGGRFSNVDPGVLTVVTGALSKHGMSLTPTANTCDYNITCGKRKAPARAFREWITGHGLAVGSHDKHVPADVMAGGPSAWEAYLSGYLDTDGHVTGSEAAPPVVSWTSVSYDLLRQVQTMLAGLGVKAALAPAGQAAWMLTVKNGPGILILADRLVPQGDKAARLARCAERVKAKPRAARDNSTYHLAPVTAVVREDPQPTWALTVADVHTHVTSGIVSHNTAGDWRWDVLGDEGPEDEVWDQVLLYGLALEAAGRRVKTLRLSYIKRCNGHDETFIRDYDEHAAKAALDRLLGYATSLDLGIDLPKTGTGPSNDALCRRCFARIHCWNMDRAAALGRSPESLTILGESPEVAAIEWAVLEKVEAARIRLAAVADEKAKKGLLDGIEPGRYGAAEGYRKGGGGGDDHKARAEQLEQYYVLPEDQRPPLDLLPVPQKARYSFIQWGKVRKATLQAEARSRAQQAKEEAS